MLALSDEALCRLALACTTVPASRRSQLLKDVAAYVEGSPPSPAATKCEVDPAGNRKPSKRKATGRIDPLVALTMAVGISTTKVEPAPSYQFFVLAR